MKEFPSRKIKCLQISTKGFNGSLICNKAAHRFPSALHLCFIFQFICNLGKKVIVGLPLPTQADNFERQTPIGQTGSLSLSLPRTTNNYPWKMRLNKFLTHRHIDTYSTSSYVVENFNPFVHQRRPMGSFLLKILRTVSKTQFRFF